MTTYMIADGGRAKVIIAKWSEELFAAEARLKEYMKEIGATGAYRLPFEKPTGFDFPGRIPKGWTQPTDSRNYSQPKRLHNGEISDKFDDLEWPKTLEQLVSEDLGLPSSFSQSVTDPFIDESLSNGARIQKYSLSWIAPTQSTEGAYILECPDFDECIKKVEGELTWLPVGTSPTPENGLKSISTNDLDALIDRSDAARGREQMEAAEAEYCRAQAEGRECEEFAL